MLSKKLLFCYIVILFISFSLLFINSCFAQKSILGLENACNCNNLTSSSSGECQKYCKGDYELNDFAQLFVNVAKWILGISGSLALLAFIYGGIMFLVSGGSSERVASAKQIIIGAVIGLIIVFTSYIIIGFIFKALGLEVDWYNSNWFN